MAGHGRDTIGDARVPALDGLRGVAVLGVLAFHGGILGITGGFLGVSTFFTLSGFLITTLLLLEWERSGRIDLLHFWARRARRLLPAALLALVGIAAYGAFVATGHQAERVGGDGISALFYVANWRFVLGDRSYAALFSAPSPVQHFWSLAIEEQFYLLFPLVMIGLLTTLRTRVNVRRALIGLAAVSAALSWVLWAPGHDPARVYYGTDTRAAELLVGAVLATMLAGRRGRSRIRWRRTAKSVAGVTALAGLVLAWLVVSQSDTFLYRGGLALHAVLTALVITAALQPGPVAGLLSWRPLRALGLVSYGVYLYHWPIFLWLDADRVGVSGLPLFAVRMTVTLAVAVASYRWVEQPIRSGVMITGQIRRWVAPVAAASVGALLLVMPVDADTGIVFSAVRRSPPAPAAAAPSRSAGAIATESPATTALPLTGPPTTTPPVPVNPPVERVMIVGDSVAITVGRGLERWGPAHGIAVDNAARPFCPIMRGGRLAASMGSTATACEDWPTRWPREEQRFRPDVVVVLTTVWDASPRQRDDWGPDYVVPGDPRFDAQLRSDWTEAVHVLQSGGARVIWLVTPCAENPDAAAGVRRMNEAGLGTVRDAGAVTVALDDFVCPGGHFTNRLQGVDGVRPDGVHFSDAGGDVVAAWLGPIVTDPRLGETPAAGSGGPLILHR